MHVMHDIETLGTKPGSIILSIGAVAFCPTERVIKSTFYINIDEEQSRALGLFAEQSTIDWWAGQSTEARAALCVNAVSPMAALADYFSWFTAVDGEFIWSHGASFDTPLVEAAAMRLDIPPPWRFWNVRDTRTIFHLAGNGPDRSKGVHHNALDDAINQAEAVIESYRILGVSCE